MGVVIDTVAVLQKTYTGWVGLLALVPLVLLLFTTALRPLGVILPAVKASVRTVGSLASHRSENRSRDRVLDTSTASEA